MKKKGKTIMRHKKISITLPFDTWEKGIAYSLMTLLYFGMFVIPGYQIAGVRGLFWGTIIALILLPIILGENKS